jgi:hypothetical protein
LGSEEEKRGHVVEVGRADDGLALATVLPVTRGSIRRDEGDEKKESDCRWKGEPSGLHDWGMECLAVAVAEEGAGLVARLSAHGKRSYEQPALEHAKPPLLAWVRGSVSPMCAIVWVTQAQ